MGVRVFLVGERRVCEDSAHRAGAEHRSVWELDIGQTARSLRIILSSTYSGHKRSRALSLRN
jgi:hypothetical protein